MYLEDNGYLHLFLKLLGPKKRLVRTIKRLKEFFSLLTMWIDLI